MRQNRPTSVSGNTRPIFRPAAARSGILEEAQLDLKRYQTLAAQNSIARQQAEDQAYIVHQDEGTVKLDEGLVEGAKLNLGYTDIISPVDGTVVSRNVTQGQTVARACRRRPCS